MRKLKFRAWDKKLKKYHPAMAFGDKTFTIFVKRVHLSSRYIVEQYTGLKDKNDKEIYFGDRLRFADKLEWYGREYSVKVIVGTMTKEEAMDEIRKKPYEERIVESIEDYDWLLSSDIQRYWEVIGNIHEDKE